MLDEVIQSLIIMYRSMASSYDTYFDKPVFLTGNSKYWILSWIVKLNFIINFGSSVFNYNQRVFRVRFRLGTRYLEIKAH